MKKKKNSLVWQILPSKKQENGLDTVRRTPLGEGDNFSPNDEPQPSFLIGTMHVRDEQAFQFESLFKEKIDACSVFAAELNLTEAKQGKQQPLFLPPEQSLDQILPNKTFLKMDKTVRRITGQSLMAFSHLKPIVLTNLILESILHQDRVISLDENLWAYATEKGKILRGIETYGEQIEIMEKMDLEGQIKNLKSTLKDISKTRRQIKHISCLYAQADIHALYKSVHKTAQGNRRLLLFDRNHVMAQRIAALASETTVCIAIGAGHLAGEKGVLKRLKDLGCHLSPCTS
jgi:hypothetical protein